MTVNWKHPRARQRWGILIGAVALVSALLGGAALAVHDVGKFELDKNASNDTNVTKLGDLAANITATATSLNICRTAASAPTTPFTILIRAERMTVNTVTASNFGGNCGGTKETYSNLTRVSGVAQAKGGVDGIISLIVEGVTKAGPDWNQVHQVIGTDPKCLTLGLVECNFVSDQIGPTTFIGGASKDHLAIEGWQHTSGASPDKAEILNAYAAKAINGTDQILYFGVDRYAVDGSTDIGFWFFKNAVVANPDGTFTGSHVGSLTTPGDILALATFTQGGAATNIRVFRWVGTGGNESGTINGPDAAAADCNPTSGPPLTGDNLCGTVNATTIEVPWTYTFKGAPSSGWIPAGGFFEGGINLTSLGLQGCFSSFLAETRSSPEITAILKDFALGDFEACGSGLTTAPGNGAGTADLTDSGAGTSLPDVSIGTGSVSVTDRATLSITGIDTWSGSMDFWLCKVDAPGLCNGTLPSTGNVGTKIGATIPVNQLTTQPIVSAAATVTSAGRYCWRGVFTSSTTGVPNATDSSATECFEVLPVTPTLSTQAIDGSGVALSGAVSFGQAVYDKAALGGTANQPGSPVINPTTTGSAAGGTITFRLYGPGTDATACATLASGFATAFPNGIVVNVSGNGDYTTLGSGFIPAAPGIYHWKAVYSGNSPNTNGQSHNSTCSDTNERVEVQQLQPTMDTVQRFVPNDAATITVASGAGNLAGSVVFSLYVNDPTCAGTAAYTNSASPIDVTTGSGSGLSRTVVSGNTTAYSTTGTTFHWVVAYTSTNQAHKNVTSACGNEHSSITISNGVTQPITP